MTGVSIHSPSKRTGARASARLGAGGGDRARLRPRRDHRQPDVDEDDLAVGVAVAVALQVGLLEALDQLGRVGCRRAGDRQLEGLSGVAHLVDDLGGGAGRVPSAVSISSATSAAIRSALRSCAREHHRAGGVAAALRGAEAERREDAAGARAEHPPDAELAGDRRGVHRAGAAEGQQREAARVDAALDGDHAQRPDHLLVGDPDDPLGGLQLPEAERAGEPRHRGPRRLGVELDAAGQPRVAREVAEQQVRVGDRRLARRRARNRRARARRRPSAARPAGRRRGRASRSSRRRRRPCARRPSAAGSGGRRSRARRCVARGRPRRRRRRRRCRPCRGRSRCRRRRRGRSARRRPRRRPGPRGRSRRRPRPPPRRSRRRRRTASPAARGRPLSLGRLAEAAQVAAEQRREVGVDRGRRAALVLAEAGQDLVRGGDVDAGKLAAQVLGEAPLVASGRGRRRAGRSRPTRRRAARIASASRRGSSSPSGSTTPSGPIRSAASKRSSGSTSGGGFGAQSR